MPVFTGNRFGFGRAESAAPGAAELPDPTIFPTSPTNFQYFSAIWDGAPADLPLSHGNSTWTAPGSQPQGYIRVIVVGGAGGSNFGSGGAGNGGLIDVLFPIATDSTERYKAIVGQGGSNSQSSGSGGHGCGGGCGVDQNGTGSGGGGSAFFYAEPPANSDPAMFPKGIAIAGGGGAGNGPSNGGLQDGAAHPTINPDPMGGFDGYNRRGYNQTENARSAFSGNIGGAGGRMCVSSNPDTNDAPWIEGGNAASARGEGGTQSPDDHSADYGGGGGGGAGAGGFGGSTPGGTPINQAGEDAPNGRGFGYGLQNPAGAGRGGEYPQKGGNGFTFNGVDLGGGAGGSHGSAAGGGGWGGGGGGYYETAGGSGGSGVWGFAEPQTDSDVIKAWVNPGSIPVNGGSVNSVCGVPGSRGYWPGDQEGYVLVMW